VLRELEQGVEGPEISREARLRGVGERARRRLLRAEVVAPPVLDDLRVERVAQHHARANTRPSWRTHRSVWEPVGERSAVSAAARGWCPACFLGSRASAHTKKAHTGFEPVSGETPVPEPLRRKLEELQAKNTRAVRGMQAPDRLARKAREYEILAASLGERAPLLGQRRFEWEQAAVAFTLAAIILREIASALEGDA
jgi:hypothetical protein